MLDHTLKLSFDDNGEYPNFTPLLWSRKLAMAAVTNIANMKPPETGIDFHPERVRKVFGGHTPVQKALKCGDHWFIDTWTSKSITIIDAITEERFVAHV